MSHPKASSSQIYSAIQQIKKKTYVRRFNEYPLVNYEVGIFEYRPFYLCAEVLFKSIDAGSDISHTEQKQVLRLGVDPGDRPCQYIPKRLGGTTGCYAAFPLNEQVDTSNWDDALQQIYGHVKEGEGRCGARLMYGIEFGDDHESSNGWRPDNTYRPKKIYFYFELFKDGKVFGEPIEGLVVNVSPIFTHEYFLKPRNKTV